MKQTVGLGLLLFLLTGVPASPLSIVDSKHNLSSTGPGTYKSLTEGEVCIFCHTPHRASSSGVLWNRGTSTTSYITYTSTTVQQAPGQPTGSSKLCLSCHDGTIALGEVLSRSLPIPFPTGLEFLNSGPAYIGTDLSDDHPVSIPYPTSGELVPVASIDLPLDHNGLIQCTSCHDPHDNQFGQFLRKANTASALCTTCHAPSGWPIASHATSPAIWDGTPPDPWPSSAETTVAANACGSCHQPHAAGAGPRLLRSTVEEDNCTGCHNGHVATLDVAADFQKPYHHPIEQTTGVHDPTEDPVSAPRHVECTDCHNPHQANASTAAAPAASGRLAGVKGVSTTGTVVDPVVNEYELCFRCHGDSSTGFAPTPRQLAQTNTRLEFDLTNPSYHPVEGPGVNPNVPSLIAPLTTTSIIYCTDCHASDSGPGAGGLGPAGPHGSIWPTLLERRYETADGTTEDATTYALCYKCHSRASILADQSFTEHKKHIEKENVPCNVCHDPHGISIAQGNATNNAHLINFDTSVVLPYNGVLKFEDLGTFTGRCTLSCHGKDHKPKTYP